MKSIALILLISAFLQPICFLLADETDEQDIDQENLLSNFRDALADVGITYEISHTWEYWTNISGGITSDNAHARRWDTSLMVTLDSEDAGFWKGGTFYTHFMAEQGDGLTDKYIGDFQTISNMDAHDFDQFAEVWYRHSFDSDRFWIQAGRIETTAIFAAPLHGGEFINASAGFSPTIPIITYPYTDWAAAGGIRPIRWLTLEAMVGRGRGTMEEDLFGSLVTLQLGLHHKPWGHEGRFTFAYWNTSAKFTALDESGILNGAQGYYMTWDQVFYYNDRGTNIGGFLQHGWAPEDRIEAKFYIGGGLEFSAVLPGRENDVFGLGLFHVHFSEDAGYPGSHETAIEVYYKLQLFPQLWIKPDVQYIIDPGGVEENDALAAGVRLAIIL